MQIFPTFFLGGGDCEYTFSMDYFIRTSLLQVFHVMGLTCFALCIASLNSESLQLPVLWHELLFCYMCHTNSLSHVPVLPVNCCEMLIVCCWNFVTMRFPIEFISHHACNRNYQ